MRSASESEISTSYEEKKNHGLVTGIASDASSSECSHRNGADSSRAMSVYWVPPRPIRPFGNSSTDSSGTSRAPKRVLSMFTGICLLLLALPEEVQERLLNDVGARVERRLVHGLLHREVDCGLRHVGVLDV